MNGRSPFLEGTIGLTPTMRPESSATPFLEAFEALPEESEEDGVLETDPRSDEMELGEVEEGEGWLQTAESALSPLEGAQAAELEEELAAIAEAEDALESDLGAERVWQPELAESEDLLDQSPEAVGPDELSTFVFESPERSDDELVFELDFEGEPVEEAFIPAAVEAPGGGRITDKRPPRPEDLVPVSGLSGKRVQLHRLAAEAWKAMAAAARNDGVAEPLLLPASGYRSIERQRELWESALRKYGPPEVARRWVAPPGSSPHHSGRAIDLWLGMKIASANAAAMRASPAHRWLVANAERFGFYPYGREPWHWEYNPAASAESAEPGTTIATQPVPAPQPATTGDAPAAEPCPETGARAAAILDRGAESTRRTFGPRGGGRMHAAMDIGRSQGSPVYAPLDGQVTFSGTKAGYGNLIILVHRTPPSTSAAGDGPVSTAYAHLERRAVAQGVCVSAGQQVGVVGATFVGPGGRTGGVRPGMPPHLHFSIQRLYGDRARPRDRFGRFESTAHPDPTAQRLGPIYSSRYEEDWTRQVHPREWLTELGIRISGSGSGSPGTPSTLPPGTTPSPPVPSPIAPTGAGVTFPSGVTLPIISVDAPVGSEHHDPNSTRNSLLDTGPANRALRLAPSFTVAEFARSGGTTYDRARIDPSLVRCLQALRDLVGKPVRITSGYRSSAHNAAIYRARGREPTRSRHSSGQAADVRIDGMTGLQIATAAIDACGCDLGLGVGADYAHIDVRGRFARWTYIDGQAGAAALEQLAAHRARRCGLAAAGIGAASLATGAAMGAAIGGSLGASIGTTLGGAIDAATEPATGTAGTVGSQDAATAEGRCGITYHSEPGREFGPRFGSMRPPGLSASTRQTSARDAATSHIGRTARSLVPSPIFERTVMHLAGTESGGMFGRPANIFDARPPSDRPPGKGLITAWGAFQFNRDAWRRLPETANDSFPWDSTPCQEILWPLRQYARLFEEVRATGGSELDAARGIRLWHGSPVAYRRYLQTGRTVGRFDLAWQAVEEARRRRVDQNLRDAGILP